MSIFMYADDIVMLAPSISALQDLLHVSEGEAELAWLDMSLDASKSMSMRILVLDTSTSAVSWLLWTDMSYYAQTQLDI